MRIAPRRRLYHAANAIQGGSDDFATTRHHANRRRLLGRRCRDHRSDRRAGHRARAGRGLKVGVLLPRSGAQAGIGQDCQRGVEIAPAILKDLGLPDLRS